MMILLGKDKDMPNDGMTVSNTAIPSWSGFVYQGKVALYHVLRLLCDNKDCDYALQLDSLEDFTIKNENTFISLHQVKARDRGPISGYGDSFGDLQGKARENKCKAYFHLANNITGKTVPEIESEYSPVKIYKYSGGNYECAVDSIDDNIISGIAKYFQAYSLDEEKRWRTNPDYLNKANVFLCEVIQKKVLSIHAEGQRSPDSMAIVAARNKIDLSELVAILEKDLNDLENQDEYFLYLTRQNLRKYFAEYMSGVDKPDAQIKLINYMCVIQNLDDDSLVSFIQNITPHRNVKFITLQDYKDNTPIHDEIRDVFFEILNELRETSFDKDKNTIMWRVGTQKVFYPTTILHPPGHESTICTRIVKNALDVDIGLMFERDCLITAGMKVDSILDEVPSIISFEGEEIPKEDKRIVNWKKVSLEKLENVREEINV